MKGRIVILLSERKSISKRSMVCLLFKIQTTLIKLSKIQLTEVSFVSFHPVIISISCKQKITASQQIPGNRKTASGRFVVKGNI